MDPVATSIITSVLSSITASGLATFMVKSFIDSHYAQKLEGWKAAYTKVLDENRIRFSRFHEEQANALKCLYAKLIQLDTIVSNIDHGDHKEIASKYIEFEKHFIETREFFRSNEILIPDILGEKIVDIINNQYILQLYKRRSTQRQCFSHAEKNLDKIDQVQREIENINLAIKKQFADLLSGETATPLTHPL